MGRKSKTWVVTAILAVSLICSPSATADLLSATESTISGAKLDPIIPGADAPLGVSPEIYFDEKTGTYYLYTTSMPSKVYTSKDGTAWVEETSAKLPNGFDWSIVKMGENNYRLYYAAMIPNAAQTVTCSKSKKSMFYATSTDLLKWTEVPGALIDDVGCGVPHVLKKSDGKYLMYYNTITSKHGIHIQSSDDGLKWTLLTGPLNNEEQLVDPAPLEMPDGTFLMISSSMSDPTRGETQRLQILSSTDGVKWFHRPNDLYAPNGFSVLDPSLKLINGKLRIWYGYTKGNDHSSAHITSGNLTLQAGQIDKKSTSVICVKGKKIKKFSGSKCPAGYKKKI